MPLPGFFLALVLALAPLQVNGAGHRAFREVTHSGAKSSVPKRKSRRSTRGRAWSPDGGGSLARRNPARLASILAVLFYVRMRSKRLLKRTVHSSAGGRSAAPRVLCVDDDRRVREGLELTLGRRYDVTLTESGAEALARLQADAPYQVIVSDLQMPNMSGVELLSTVRREHPDLVRLLLTGVSDLEAAVQAVNDGQLFRFLTKPCPPEQLLAAVAAAARQHQLEESERVLLEVTLRRSIEVLVEVLALTHPQAFGRAMRLRSGVRELSKQLEIPKLWQVEIAALLSQLGSVELDPDVLRKADEGAPLTDVERRELKRLPQLSDHVLGSIPRLEGAREILAQQGSSRWHRAPIGARVLRVLSDFDELESEGLSPDEALGILRQRSPAYDPEVVCALERTRAAGRGDGVLEVALDGLESGMVLERDVRRPDGGLLIARGHRITGTLLARLQRMEGKALSRTFLVRAAEPAPANLPK